MVSLIAIARQPLAGPAADPQMRAFHSLAHWDSLAWAASPSSGFWPLGCTVPLSNSVQVWSQCVRGASSGFR